MHGAARSGDDDLEAGGLRALGEGDQTVGGAMGGDDPRLMSDAKRVQRLGGAAHDRPIRLAAHDDGDRLRAPLMRRSVHGPIDRVHGALMGLALKGRP